MHVRAVVVTAVLLAGCASSTADAEGPEAGSSEASGTADTSVDPSSGSSAMTTGESAGAASSDAASGGGEGSSSGAPPPPPNLTPGCGTEPSGDVLDGVITIRDVERTYLIEIPADYDPQTPYPLVFGFHGDGGDSTNARNGYRLSEWYEGQAIVVYPDGSGAGGSPAWVTVSDEADVEMVMSLAEEIGYEMCFDLNRVFAFGYSRGSAMTHAMGCYRGDFFRAIGASSGWAPSTGLCQQPIGVFMSHGYTDDRVPFSTGRADRDAWAQYNGCAETTVELSEPGCIAFEGCNEGAPVQWCEFDGGHTFDSEYARIAVDMFKSL